MENIKDVLMNNGLTSDESDSRIEEVQELLAEYLADGDMEAAYDICMDEFGLEPDYLLNLI